MREKGTNAFYAAKWSDWGGEVMNSVGCSDCMMPERWIFGQPDQLCMRHGHA